MPKLTHQFSRWLAEELASVAYALERLNARQFDAPWQGLRNRSGKPC